jgi:hypothetical protein
VAASGQRVLSDDGNQKSERYESRSRTMMRRPAGGRYEGTGKSSQGEPRGTQILVPHDVTSNEHSS